MIIRKSLMAAGALALALALAACGSDGSTTAVGTSATTSAPTNTAAAPTTPELQETLTVLTDPARPVDDKVALVVDGEQRRANLEAMSAAMTNYAVSFTVSDVAVDGDIATANVAIRSPHGEVAPTPWTWQNVAGTWKLSDESVCSLLGMARATCG